MDVFGALKKHAQEIEELYSRLPHNGVGHSNWSRQNYADALARETDELVPHYVRGESDLDEPTFRLLQRHPQDDRLRSFWRAALMMWERDPTWRYNRVEWFLMAWVASGNHWPTLTNIMNASTVLYRWRHSDQVHAWDAGRMLHCDEDRLEALLKHMNMLMRPGASRNCAGAAKRERTEEREGTVVLCLGKEGVVFLLKRQCN